MNAFDKINNYLIKKEYSKFLASTGVVKGDSDSVIDEKIISYAKKSQKLWTIALSERQRSDSQFILKLYKEVPEIIPYDMHNKELDKDEDFLIATKKIYSDSHINNGYNILGSIHLVFDGFKHRALFKNPEFVKKVANAFPKQNIVREIKHLLAGWQVEDQYDYFEHEVLPNLDIEFLREQARKFGWDMLNGLPKEYLKDSTLISSGIECDNFKSLKLLDINELPKNITLINKAYNYCSKEKNVNELINFLRYNLSPDRSEVYMCHGEAHSYYYHDEKYEIIRQALLNNQIIQNLLNDDRIK